MSISISAFNELTRAAAKRAAKRHATLLGWIGMGTGIRRPARVAFAVGGHARFVFS
jgi:hypothetical protein